jgi:NADH-quinone oxidoreductase subunit B
MYVPGCPPRPELLMHGILKLHEKILRGEPRSQLVLPEASPRKGALVGREA